mgnify:CR=1 FL=1
MMTDEKQQEFYQTLGDIISRVRGQKGMTQAELAQHLGMSRASIVNIEKGRQRPALHIIWEIARLCELNPTELLGSLAYGHKTEGEKEFKQNVIRQSAGNSAIQSSLLEFVEKAD